MWALAELLTLEPWREEWTGIQPLAFIIFPASQHMGIQGLQWHVVFFSIHFRKSWTLWGEKHKHIAGPHSCKVSRSWVEPDVHLSKGEKTSQGFQRPLRTVGQFPKGVCKAPAQGRGGLLEPPWKVAFALWRASHHASVVISALTSVSQHVCWGGQAGMARVNQNIEVVLIY